MNFEQMIELKVDSLVYGEDIEISEELMAIGTAAKSEES